MAMEHLPTKTNKAKSERSLETTQEKPSASSFALATVELPFNFRLEAYIDERGILTTNQLGISLEGSAGSWSNALRLEKLGFELRTLAVRQYKLTHDQLLLLSSYTPAGELMIWLRSTIPVGRDYLKSAERPLELVHDDAIDVTSIPSTSPSVTLPPASSRVVSPKRLPSPRAGSPDSSVVDLP